MSEQDDPRVPATAPDGSATPMASPTAGEPLTGPPPPPPPPPPPLGEPPPPPPPPPPLPLPPAVAARRRRSLRLVAAGGVAFVVVVGAVALVVGRGGGEPSATEALERAQAAIAEVDTFRMHATSEDRAVTGDPDGAGSSTVFRTVSDTEVAGDAVHAVYDSGDWADETVSLAEGVYLRSAASTADLAGEPWELLPPDTFDAALPAGDDLRDELLLMLGLDFDGDGEIDPDVVEDEFLEGMVVPGLAAYYLIGVGAAGVDSPAGAPVVLPAGLVETFGSFEDAEVVSDSGDELVIAATRSIPPDVAEGIDVELPPGRFEITLGADDLPTRLELTVDGTDAHYSETVEFSDWGADIAIGVPEGEIDETPWLDEEALAEVRGTVEALAPTAVPDGLELGVIEALSTEDAEEFGNEPCAQLILSYMPPITDELATEEWTSSPDYLDVYLLPQACALDYDDTPFEPGEFGDVPSRETDIYVEVLVRETVVQFDTTYTDDLPAMVASIQPFDLDAELARLAPLAEETWNAGWSPYPVAEVSVGTGS